MRDNEKEEMRRKEALSYDDEALFSYVSKPKETQIQVNYTFEEDKFSDSEPEEYVYDGAPYGALRDYLSSDDDEPPQDKPYHVKIVPNDEGEQNIESVEDSDDPYMYETSEDDSSGG